MENRSHVLSAGLFTLLLIAALVAVAVWFRQDTVVRDRYVLVSTSSVSGLNAQAAVRLRGVDVGKVESIRFDPENPQAILITALIDRDAPLSRGTRAQLGYQGVTGLAYVDLSDDGRNPAKFEYDARSLPRIPVDPSLVDQLITSGPALIKSVDETARRVALLMSDENLALLTSTLTNIEIASGKLAKVADQALPVLAQATPALKATAAVATDASLVLKRTDQLVANVNTFTLALGQRLESIDRITKSAEQIGNVGLAFGEAVVSVALPKISDFIDELSRNSRVLERVLNDFQDQPQSLVFGRGPQRPGPGEAGYIPPAPGER
ncbi:MAG: MCE family protein [Proteobacteria bacterium]|nr:MCE family protein [Burkholderiales bacterium]